MPDIDLLADLMRQWHPAIVLTGAGISTDSGIPDFRSKDTGLWNRVDPTAFLTPSALRERPAEFWTWFAQLFAPALGAEPNPGHRALAKLCHAGYVDVIVTQNVDGLHQKAGCDRVLEVHGHLRTARCSLCGTAFPLKDVLNRLDTEPVPQCPCGGRIRPDVVLFEDPMPPAFEEAMAAVSSCSLLLVVGSSLTVWPANSLAYLAPHLAIINRDPTPADAAADVVIRGPASRTLNALIESLHLSPAGEN
ncbi:MAG TPA: NAD-dependent deacylase [Firmicutes bacterium]|nr:NAD-dependent deacylase [Bacillota bacterium]